MEKIESKNDTIKQPVQIVEVFPCSDFTQIEKKRLAETVSKMLTIFEEKRKSKIPA
ncbi:MAG: hypothetical protein PHG19_03715 [Anaerotignum sp.]|nr:hypothetical protein [Anaerotignum sp.]